MRFARRVGTRYNAGRAAPGASGWLLHVTYTNVFEEPPSVTGGRLLFRPLREFNQSYHEQAKGGHCGYRVPSDHSYHLISSRKQPRRPLDGIVALAMIRVLFPK